MRPQKRQLGCRTPKRAPPACGGQAEGGRYKENPREHRLKPVLLREEKAAGLEDSPCATGKTAAEVVC